MSGGWPVALITGSGDLTDVKSGGNSPISYSASPRATSPRLRLSTIGDCKREIAKLYREVRRGELASTEATRLVWLLNTLANLIADHDLEKRLAQLEKRG